MGKNKICLICGAKSTAQHLSFHKFPKNESTRIRWIEALELSNKSVNFNTAFICSKHFDKYAFFLHANPVRRRLCSYAVPKLTVEASISSNNDETIEDDNKTTENYPSNTRKSTDDEEMDENLKNYASNSKKSIDEESINLEDEFIENCPSKKRKNSDDKHKQNKRLRFINDHKVEYMDREDFVSDEAWNKFLRFVSYNKLKISAARKKNLRNKQKIMTLKGMVDTLEQKEEFQAAEYLKDLPEHFKQLLIRIKEQKPTTPFPNELKTFARTLHFHSPSAYEMVRRSFLNCLPCTQTLNNWICTTNYSPGISEEIINNVAKIVYEESKKSKKLVFNITFDEMSIKQHKEWDQNTHTWRGLVDLGGQLVENQNESQVATKALVFMLVNINGGFKVPVAHYLIHSLNGIQKSILLKDLLIKLHEKSIKVVSITFDGDRAHKICCEALGANLNYANENFQPFFEHPGSLEPVYIFYDPCHCLKLVRNYFATKGPIIVNENEHIRWDFIKKLNEKQQNEKLHCACKISNRHVQFEKEKMRVFLAAQVLSNSVASALEYNEFTLNDPNFKNSSTTANFCKVFNDIFDLLNVRNKFCKTPGRMSIHKETLKDLEIKIEEYIKYIENLKIIVPNKSQFISEQNNNIKSVLNCDSVNTGFLGFIICLKNLYSLANDLINDNTIDYLLSYKLSQDHIEMFFSSIRSLNGFNNNPTTTQYKSAYKKILANKLDISISSSANCIPMDETLLISEEIFDNNYLENKLTKKFNEGLNKTKKIHSDILLNYAKDNISNYHIFEHNYFKFENNNWTCSEYAEDIIKHTAGAVVRIVQSKIHCTICRDILDGSDSNFKSQLTLKKNRGGLRFASDDVNFICKSVEKVIRQQKNILKKNINLQIITETLRILPNNILNDNKHSFEQEPLMEHRHQLILLIIQKYLDIRLKHEGKIMNDKIRRIRMQNNKITIFKGQ